MKYIVKGTLSLVARINNSTYGNPRYECQVVPFEEERVNPMALVCGRIAGKTASDAMFAYDMPHPGNWVQATYHVTRTGRVVFDHIEVL